MSTAGADKPSGGKKSNTASTDVPTEKHTQASISDKRFDSDGKQSK